MEGILNGFLRCFFAELRPVGALGGAKGSLIRTLRNGSRDRGVLGLVFVVCYTTERPLSDVKGVHARHFCSYSSL